MLLAPSSRLLLSKFKKSIYPRMPLVMGIFNPTRKIISKLGRVLEYLLGITNEDNEGDTVCFSRNPLDFCWLDFVGIK
jgi:hypothetical protein